MLPERTIRVAHLVSHPIQYFAPLYRAIARRPEVDLTVYFYSKQGLGEYFDTGFGRKLSWDVPLLGGYSHHLPPPRDQRTVAAGFDKRPSWWVLRELLRKRFDVIWLHGYMFANSWLAAAFGRLTDTPVLLRDDQILLTPRSTWKRRLKNAILPILYRNVNGLYVGESNKDFFRQYGTPRIFLFRYCIDNELFRKAYENLKGSREDCRRKFGIKTASPTILFSGKLIDKKQPQLLLQAFSLVRKELDCNLLFVGDGPLRNDLEKTAKAQAIPDVHFAGFLNQTELPAAYTAADIFVLPSAYEETWGLVVNEAMNFDLPVIVSDRVGCGRDLVREGENGYIFRSGDAKALAQAIARLVQSPEERRCFGLRSSDIVSEYTAESCAQQLVQACLSVTSTAP